MFQDDYNEYSDDKSGNDFADEDNYLVELIPYQSDVEEEEKQEEEGGMEHTISKTLQKKANGIENRNNVKIPVTSMTLEKDVHVNHETLMNLDTIKCELVSIMQSECRKYNLKCGTLMDFTFELSNPARHKFLDFF